MRRLLASLALLAACVVAIGCGDDESDSAAGAGATTTEERAAFPVTIEHKYGTTELTERPERVVSVGLNEQDAFFALGVAPVGVTDWMGFENGIGPWAETAAKAAGDPPELLTNTDGIQFEKVAALRPDVIVALYSDLKRSDYESSRRSRRSSPRRTVTPTSASHGRRRRAPWAGRRRARGGGEAHRRPRGAHRKGQGRASGVAGRSASMAMSYEGIWVYGPDDPRSRLLTDLGFVLLAEISSSSSGWA